MTKRLLILAADLLQLASNEFSNHGCNDYKTPPDMTDEDLQDIADLLDMSNFKDITTREELAKIREDWPDDVTDVDSLRAYMMDWMLMRAMEFMLRREADSR